MKTINKISNRVLSYLVNQAIQNDGHIKISNDKTFMPVCVEVIDENDNYRFISVAHYYEQNGDLMADPEMCFIQYKVSNEFVPYYYKMDAFGTYQESVTIEDGKPTKYAPRLQAAHTTFANIWFKNIKFQQDIKI